MCLLRIPSENLPSQMGPYNQTTPAAFFHNQAHFRIQRCFKTIYPSRRNSIKGRKGSLSQHLTHQPFYASRLLLCLECPVFSSRKTLWPWRYSLTVNTSVSPKTVILNYSLITFPNSLGHTSGRAPIVVFQFCMYLSAFPPWTVGSQGNRLSLIMIFPVPTVQ